MVILHSDGTETPDSDPNSRGNCSRCGEWAYHGSTTADVDVITRTVEHNSIRDENGGCIDYISVHASGQYVRVRLCESCIDALTNWMGF